MQLGHRHHRACRAVITQCAGVDLVERRPVFDPRHVHRDFHQILRRAAGRLEDFQHIRQCDLGLFGKRRRQVMPPARLTGSCPEIYSVSPWRMAWE